MVEAALEQIRGARDFLEVAQAIRRAEFSHLDSREVMATARKLARLEKPGPSVRIALLGTHTFNPLPDYFSVRAAASGRVAECWVAPYGQYMQTVSPPADELRVFQPDIVVLSVQLQSIAPRVVYDFASLTTQDAQSERRRILDHLLNWAELATRATSGTVLLCNFPRPRYPALGVADAKNDSSETAFYLRLNLELLEALQPSNRIRVLDLDEAVAGYGADRAWTHRMYYVSRQPWQPGLCATLARDIWRHVIASKGWARKCLVLDLDNTLWGGVAGEDGPLGLKIGAGDPIGEAYTDFQRAVRNQMSRGVLLAVASKNNPEDVDAVFEQRPEMPLRKDDFAVMQVGWDTKVHALEQIAATLNIGIDSLVFLDDNPAERAMVRGALPEVLVPELPDTPALYASFLRSQGWFERPKVTSEDLAKTRQYKEQAEREVLRRAAGSLDHYLADLGTEVQVRRARPEDAPRVQQLFTKTNQFNLTTRRYGLGEVEEFTRSSQHVLGVASACDRYGDLGLIGVFLIRLDEQDAEIDSLLISCRALGRGIETAIMNALKQEVRRCRPRGDLVAHFVPTAKNAPARGYLEGQGLSLAATAADGQMTFRTPVANLRSVEVPHIRLECRTAS